MKFTNPAFALGFPLMRSHLRAFTAFKKAGCRASAFPLRTETSHLLLVLASLSARSASSGMSRPQFSIALDAFARRQWKQDYKGLVINGISEADFETKVNELFEVNPKALKDGYAPFCKHLFVPCFLSDATVEAVPITSENRHLLRSEYEARKPEELPVLVRWFPKEEVSAPAATFLDLILYSREQLIKENEAMGGPPGAADSPAAWGLISIKPQLVDFEIPMQPITMMRNALGKDQGGSGVPLDAGKYRESVRYWSAHATIA